MPEAVKATMFVSEVGASGTFAALIEISLDILELKPKEFLDSNLNLYTVLGVITCDVEYESPVIPLSSTV